MTDDPAHEPARTAAIDFRNELLASGWPDDRRVVELTGKTSDPEASTYATQARVRGALLGVWSGQLHGFVHPDFQFDHSGAIRKEIAALLAILPARRRS